MPTASANSDALAQLCLDLRALREQAGGPSVRALGEKVGLGKSQVDAILNGRIRRPPDWDVVRGLVEAFYKYAHDCGRQSRLSIQAGLEEYWRPRYAMVEQAFSQPAANVQRRRRPTGPADEHNGVQPQPNAVVPRQLPPIAPHFAGRAVELAALTAASGPLLLNGMAGVGKTTLAVAWAHQVAHRFPDGQLYVNLRGFDPSGRALTTAQALRGLLEALGVAPRSIPQDFEAQVGLYRSLMAHRQTLVLLDNARDVEQVRALLPGAGTCQVVITSRLELTGLVVAEGAHPLRLDVLLEADARRLLARRVGEERVSAEPDAADEIIGLCGRLPIALAIVGARAATRPEFPLSAIVEQMRQALRGLDAFHIDDSGADLRALFSWSYQALSPGAARLFRLLSLHVGGHVGTDAAASLLGVAAAQVIPLIAELTGAHLVTEVAPGRYSFHDLVRAYAIETVTCAQTEQERRAARLRVLDHYLHTSYNAALLMSPQRAPIAVEPISAGVTVGRLRHRDEAMRWFSAEYAVLLAAAEHAVTAGYDTHAWQLGWSLADFLELRGHFHDWIVVQQHAVAAARRLEDPQTLARNLVILGNACLFADAHDQARTALHEALDVYRGLGDAAGQGRCEHTLGGLLERQGHYAGALDCARRALEHYRTGHDREGQARSHNAIGWCLYRLGEHQQAIEHCQQALQWYQELGDVFGQAATWDSLGSAHHSLRQHTRALHCFGQALGLVRGSGDRFNEAGVLLHLGDTHDAAGDKAAAAAAWGQALAIFDDLDHPDAGAVRARLAAAGCS